MKFTKMVDSWGEEIYGTYKVTSPFFPEKIIYLPNDGLDIQFKDEFIWALFEKIDFLEQKLSINTCELTNLTQQHIKRAFNMQKLADEIKELKKNNVK